MFALNCFDLTTGRISMAEGNANPHEMSSETFHEIEMECSDVAPEKLPCFSKLRNQGGIPYLWVS